MQKKAYEAPKLVVHGNVAELTQSNNPNANFTDADFPTNTPRDQITYGDPS